MLQLGKLTFLAYSVAWPYPVAYSSVGIAGGVRGVRPPVHVSDPPAPVIRLSWGGSDITPLVRCSHSQKILYCTVEVNFPIYTASTHGKISQFVMWILDGLHRHRHLLIVNGLQYSGRGSTLQAMTASRVRG